MRRAAAVLSLVLATACATSRPAGSVSRLESAAARPVPSPALATRSVIPLATLELDPSLSLYDVVGRYWPQALRPPMRSAVANLDARGDVVGVYVDGNFTGGQESLRSIRASAVRSIQRLTRSEEFMKWGRAHEGGAVVVTLR